MDPIDFREHGDVLDNPRAPRPIAVEGVLRVGDLCLITGSYDTFKSTLAMELAWSLAIGRPWLGNPAFRIARKIRTGILQTEIDPGAYDERCARFPRAADLLVASCMDFTFDRMKELAETLDDADLAGIVIDPLGQVWPPMSRSGEPFSENSKTHVSPIMRELKHLGRTVILVHHDPKVSSTGFQGRASGSSALLNDPDVRMFVDRKPDSDDIRVTVRNRLQNPAKPFTATFQTDKMRLVMNRPAPGSSDREGKGEDEQPPRSRLPSSRFNRSSNRVVRAAERRNS